MKISKTTANKIILGSSYLGIVGCLAANLYFSNPLTEESGMEKILGVEYSAQDRKDYSNYAVLLAGLFTGAYLLALTAYALRDKEEKAKKVNIE